MSDLRLCSEKFRVISSLVNPMGRLGLFGTLNLLQDTSWLHARLLGADESQPLRDGLMWVFTRQKLEMREWPRAGEFVTVKTWLRPPDGVFIPRNFVVVSQNGQEIGQSSASFIALDLATRKIVPAQNLRDWQTVAYDRDLFLAPEKIQLQQNYELINTLRVRNSDLDGNQHVNNTKYAQWILDSVPYQLHQDLVLTSYSVNFLVETKLGDEVQIFEAPLNHSTQDSGTTSYKGQRVSDGKTLFTAELGWKKRN